MIKLRKWSDSSDVDVAVLAEELEQLLLAVYEVSLWTADQVAEVLRSDVNSCALAEDESRLVGFLVWQETDFEAEVLQIAVLPSYQGQKIATALFDFCLPTKKFSSKSESQTNERKHFTRKKRWRSSLSERPTTMTQSRTPSS